jgi:Na+-driven multidrug efflux pump
MGFRGKAVSAVVTSLIGIPLIRELGITGAALGMIVTQVCWTAVYLWGLRSIRSSWAARIDGIRTAYHFPVAGLPITRPS